MPCFDMLCPALARSKSSSCGLSSLNHDLLCHGLHALQSPKKVIHGWLCKRTFLSCPETICTCSFEPTMNCSSKIFTPPHCHFAPAVIRFGTIMWPVYTCRWPFPQTETVAFYFPFHQSRDHGGSFVATLSIDPVS